MNADEITIDIGNEAFDVLGISVEEIEPIIDKVEESVKEIGERMSGNG